MTRVRRLSPGVVLSATLAGFLLAHAVDYALVFPDAGERSAVLDATGHTYLHSLSGLGWVAFALGLLGALAAGIRRGTGRTLSTRAAVALLAAAQSAFFVAAEITERIAAHEPPGDLVRTPLLLVGLAAQVAVALLLVALLALADGAGRRLPLATPVRRPAPEGVAHSTPYVSLFRPALRARRAAARGPPVW